MSADLVTRRVAELLRAPHEHDGQRVVLLTEIDRVHGRKHGTARSAFRRHRRRMTEGTHFFRLDRTTVSQSHGGRGSRGEAVVALTERGYLLLVKAFNDDLAWSVQDRLVESYFRVRALASGDEVLVSRAELEQAHRDAEHGARLQVRLARWVKGAISRSARDLNSWKALGPTARALALEDPDQVRIPGVEFRAVVADLSAAAVPEARAAHAIETGDDGDLVALLGQLVTKAVSAAIPAALDRALANRT